MIFFRSWITLNFPSLKEGRKITQFFCFIFSHIYSKWSLYALLLFIYLLYMLVLYSVVKLLFPHISSFLSFILLPVCAFIFLLQPQ